MLALQIIAIILWTIALVFTILTFCQLLPKKEKEKPTSKTPIEIELQIEYEGYLYTLYNDGTWDIDITW